MQQANNGKGHDGTARSLMYVTFRPAVNCLEPTHKRAVSRALVGPARDRSAVYLVPGPRQDNNMWGKLDPKHIHAIRAAPI